MATLSQDSLVVRSEDFITSTVDDDLVMMSLEKGIYYGLDAIGSQIWENIAEPISVNALCHKLTDQFEVDEAQCQTDVLAFLHELLNEEMIHVVNQRAG
jgi:hypothetical protein